MNKIANSKDVDSLLVRSSNTQVLKNRKII